MPPIHIDELGRISSGKCWSVDLRKAPAKLRVDLSGLDFHTAGTLEKNISFFVLPSSDPTGSFHFETVMARLDNLFGSSWLNVKLGKFELDNLLSEKRILTFTGNGGIYQVLTSKLRDYYSLTKPEVNLLILMTTSAGYYLANRGPLRIGGLVSTLVGTLLVASGTATLNQWMERVWDGQMRRTANRPLPAGRLSSREALLFGIVLSVAGGLYLAATVNLLSAFLAVSTLLLYLVVYTPLKRRTPLCTLLGAFPGAMPTLIGWAGASAGIDRHAWYLFAILFLWQFPHFLAIALMYRDDYARAGYRMLPEFDLDSRGTRAEIVGFTLVLIAATMLPLATRGGPINLTGMFLAGAFLLYHVTKLAQSTSKGLASRVVHASVIYLPVVLGLMIAGKGHFF